MRSIVGFGVALVVVGLAAAGWLWGDDEVVLSPPVPIPAESPFRYPIELWDQRVEGESILMVHVTEDGTVDTAYVLTSSGRAAFDSAALAGSRALRFRPGYRGEEPVASWARLPVRFRMPADTTDRGNR